MRFDNGEQNLAPTNGTCWYRSRSNLRLEGSSKSQAPNPKESPNPDTQIRQESVGVGIVGDSLRFGFWNLGFRPRRVYCLNGRTPVKTIAILLSSAAANS